jgi:hypothetical protein
MHGGTIRKHLGREEYCSEDNLVRQGNCSGEPSENILERAENCSG